MAEAVADKTRLSNEGISLIVAELVCYFEVMWNQEPAPKFERSSGAISHQKTSQAHWHPVDEFQQLAVGAEQEFKHGVEKRCEDKFDNLHEVEAKHQDAVNIMNFKLEEVERKLRADFSCQSQATDSRIARLRTEVASSAEKGGEIRFGRSLVTFRKSW